MICFWLQISSLRVNPGGGGGGTPIIIRTVRVCAPRKPPSPHFSTWAAPKDPLFKDLQFFVPLFRPSPIEKTLVFLKKIRFFVIFSSKIPCFPVSGRSESPRFSVRGRSLSPPPLLNPVRPHFKPCAAHIYQFHI